MGRCFAASAKSASASTASLSSIKHMSAAPLMRSTNKRVRHASKWKETEECCVLFCVCVSVCLCHCRFLPPFRSLPLSLSLSLSLSRPLDLSLSTSLSLSRPLSRIEQLHGTSCKVLTYLCIHFPSSVLNVCVVQVLEEKLYQLKEQQSALTSWMGDVEAQVTSIDAAARKALEELERHQDFFKTLIEKQVRAT